MDGRGYPRGLRREQMSPLARMMAIADIFEALTAVDRPYKKGKTLSETVAIMLRMQAEGHIDPELFALFLRSGVYLDYAREHSPRRSTPLTSIDCLHVRTVLAELPDSKHRYPVATTRHCQLSLQQTPNYRQYRDKQSTKPLFNKRYL
jgi:hypothetical protein